MSISVELTEEQKRKIEENRQRALLIREQKAKERAEANLSILPASSPGATSSTAQKLQEEGGFCKGDEDLSGDQLPGAGGNGGAASATDPKEGGGTTAACATSSTSEEQPLQGPSGGLCVECGQTKVDPVFRDTFGVSVCPVCKVRPFVIQQAGLVVEGTCLKFCTSFRQTMMITP
jgi:hypothetical protein